MKTKEWKRPPMTRCTSRRFLLVRRLWGPLHRRPWGARLRRGFRCLVRGLHGQIRN
uniref:Uncharacterized protein n=1 Tax=Arundo donax TaxID=35708 RepID=A0A0A9HHH2_ARUDO